MGRLKLTSKESQNQLRYCSHLLSHDSNSLIKPILQGKVAEVKKLLIRLEPNYINSADSAGWTPLMVATYYGRPKIVNTLLMHSANVNAASKHGATALAIVYERRHSDNISASLKSQYNDIWDVLLYSGASVQGNS